MPRLTAIFAILAMLQITLSGSAWRQNQPSHQSQWYDVLPDCPCKDPDFHNVILNDGWAKDKGNIDKYHKGAFSSYRSYPPAETTEGLSAQQCCYDENGDLIKDGQGAGTPDKVSTCRGEDSKGEMLIRWSGLLGHYRKDVKPWKKLMKADTSNGWKAYNELWKPNQGLNCQNN